MSRQFGARACAHQPEMAAADPAASRVDRHARDLRDRGRGRAARTQRSAATNTVSREKLEAGGERAMLSSGAGGALIACPGELDAETGATIVCTYVDRGAEVAHAALGLEPGSSGTGRVGIRIAGWHKGSSLPGEVPELVFAAG